MKESSSSSSDSEIVMEVRDLDLLHGIRRPKIYKNYNNPLDFYSDEEFRCRYRFVKPTFYYIVNILKEDLQSSNMRGLPLCVEDQLFITLRYYATNSFQTVLGDLCGVDRATVCRTVRKVNLMLASKFHQYVQMASEEEQQNSSITFFMMNGIPRILGIIDGTHIPIISPGGTNAELFRNRKGWFSINCQVVCDVDHKIIDLTARWHGSAHDQTIFNFSLIKIKLENGQFGDRFLLGDKGYSNKNYLLTPLRNPHTEREYAYNIKHMKTRILVERCIGIWKRRFPSIATKSRLHISNTLKMIVATAVLHNIAMARREPAPTEPEVEVPNIYIQPVPISRNQLESASEDRTRNLIIENL